MCWLQAVTTHQQVIKPEHVLLTPLIKQNPKETCHLLHRKMLAYNNSSLFNSFIYSFQPRYESSGMRNVPTAIIRLLSVHYIATLLSSFFPQNSRWVVWLGNMKVSFLHNHKFITVRSKQTPTLWGLEWNSTSNPVMLFFSRRHWWRISWELTTFAFISIFHECRWNPRRQSRSRPD